MGRRGVALVASLLVLAALGLLGAASLFAATLSLRQARNVHARAVAEAGAAAGLELGIGLLLGAARTQGRLPPTFDLPVLEGWDYRLVDYRSSGSDAALSVEARTEGAVVRVEALLVVDPAGGARVASRR